MWLYLYSINSSNRSNHIIIFSVILPISPYTEKWELIRFATNPENYHIIFVKPYDFTISLLIFLFICRVRANNIVYLGFSWIFCYKNFAFSVLSTISVHEVSQKYPNISCHAARYILYEYYYFVTVLFCVK